jgi:RNA polymerase primary sigma factor
LTGQEPSFEMIGADSSQGRIAVARRLEEAALMPRYTLEDLGAESPLDDLLWDPYAPNGVTVSFNNELGTAIEELLATLSEREAGVITLRFGLVDDRPKTYDEIGREFGVTRERIRQIEKKTMSKLRARSAVLRPFLEPEPEWWYED